MCRFLAYRGSPILLEELVSAPTHSLIDQSLHAQEAKLGNQIQIVKVYETLTEVPTSAL